MDIDLCVWAYHGFECHYMRLMGVLFAWSYVNLFRTRIDLSLLLTYTNVKHQNDAKQLLPLFSDTPRQSRRD